MSDDDLSGFGSGSSLRKEDILFPSRSSEEQQLNIIDAVGWDWVYSNGFRLAAHHLANQVSETGTEKIFMIYPILYLYRHCVELELKAIIVSAFWLLDRELTKHDLKTLGCHDLWELWQAARPLLDHVCECASTPPFIVVELEWVDSYIHQIHESDPDGQRFRYATMKAKGANRSGSAAARSLSPDLELKNVKEITTAMGNLVDYLEGIEGWLVELEDAKIEVERICGLNYRGEIKLD